MNKTIKAKGTFPIWLAWVLLLLLFALPLAFVASYFLRSNVIDMSGTLGPTIIREFPTDWELHIFSPFADLESRWTGKLVFIRRSEAVAIEAPE